MVRALSIRSCSLVFLICAFFVAQSYSQVDQGKLNSLKNKYPWGSIYLTHTSLLNLECILKDELRIKSIIKENGQPVVSLLRAFIESEKGKKINESVAFVEINLNRVEAGFKRITDHGGEIAPLSWGKEEVVRVADVCDRELKSLRAAADVKRKIDKNESISTVWEGLATVQTDSYISDELVYVLASDFRLRLNNQEAQLNELKSQNAALFESVTKFKTEFDGSLISYQKHFWSKEIAVSNDRLEFMEKVRAFENNFREPFSFRDLASAIATLDAQVKRDPELFSAPSPRLQTELLGNYQANETAKETVSTLSEHQRELSETTLERAALLAFALEDYRRASEFVDTGLGLSPDNKHFLATRGLIQYEQSLYPQALTTLRQAAPSAAVANPNFRAALMSNEGLVQLGLGQTGNAETTLNNSIPLFRGDDAKQQQAYLLLTQADFYVDYGQPAKALKLSEEALKLVATSGSDRQARIMEGRIHRLRAKVSLFRGVINEANQEIERAINRAESSFLELAQDKDVQADIEELTGKQREALKTLQEAAALYKDTNYIKGQSENQWKRAKVLLTLSEFDEAEKLIHDASIGFTQLNYRRGLGDCEALRGVLILRRAGHQNLEPLDPNLTPQEKERVAKEFADQVRPAIERFENAVRIFREIGYKRGLAYAQDKLAISVLQLASNDAPSKEAYRRIVDSEEGAAQIYVEIDDKRGQAEAFGNLGIIYRRYGQYELAESNLKRALEICIRIEFKLGTGRQLYNLGKLYYEKGFGKSEQDLRKSKDYFLDAQKRFKETQAGEDELQLIEKYLKSLSKVLP